MSHPNHKIAMSLKVNLLEKPSMNSLFKCYEPDPFGYVNLTLTCTCGYRLEALLTKVEYIEMMGVRA